MINKSNETAVLLKDGVEFNSETGECVSGPGHYQIMSFTPEKKNGTVDMTFNFDATGLAGSSVVVYEEIYVKIDNKLYLVADHKDLSNTSQTIDYPGVTTTAKIRQMILTMQNRKRLRSLMRLITRTLKLENIYRYRYINEQKDWKGNHQKG